jgi:uncharacterized membrane protein YphA (DoxX/SURF4 family)
MKKFQDAAILTVRIILGLTFLSAVADRFGLWGAPGDEGIAWGNWPNFVAYTAQTNSFLPASMAGSLAFVATTLEVVLASMLIIGFKTRVAAVGSALLMLSFALAMAVSFGIKTPFDYSVFAGFAACFLLATVDKYRWSLDALMSGH